MEEKKIEDSNVTSQPVSRQVRKQELRQRQKQEEAMRKQLNAVATKKDLVQTHMFLKSLADRIYHLDILTSAIERTVVDKGLITREDLKNAYTIEAERAIAFEEIQKDQTDDYEVLLQKCKKHEIDPNVTVITERLAYDDNILEEEKIRLATEYGITRILNPKERAEIQKPLENRMVKLKR